MSQIKIHNVMTNIVGRTKTERIVPHAVWQNEILPIINTILTGPSVKHHNALIGHWIVEYIGNDAHMHEFFTKNWLPAPANSKPVVKSYVINGLRDREQMKTLLGLKTEADVEKHLESFLQAIQNKKYRSTLRDEKLKNIEQFPKKEQLDIALFAPATVYSPDEFSFVSINTNYYGQLKSKSSLGPLEEFLIRKAKLDAQGRITNPQDVWLSMHAGCVEYFTDKGKKRGIVIIAPTGTGKSTHCYGLVEAKSQNKLHSDDWSFVNLGTREVAISENQFYMRTNIAGVYSHLIPLLVCQPLENVGFTPDMVALLEQFDSPEAIAKAIQSGKITKEQHQKLIEQMVETNAARSLIDPRIMVGKEKFINHTQMTDLFLFKRDYDSTMILKVIHEDEAVEIMTSEDNVFNYDYGKVDPDGYGVPQSRSTEIYYNPYLCQMEVDRKKGKISPLDKIRIEAYRTLAREKGVTFCWVNTRLPAAQTQLCLRRFLEDGIDDIRLIKGKEIESSFLSALKLSKKDKPVIPGRREHDLIGLHNSEGREVEVIGFYSQGKLIDTHVFAK